MEYFDQESILLLLSNLNADTTMYRSCNFVGFFAHENMSKLQKIDVLPAGPNHPESQILFHKNSSPNGLNTNTLVMPGKSTRARVAI